jgi:hypothetical protein
MNTWILQVFEDVSGGVVVSFDATRAIAEGDLSSYMQNFARNNSVVSMQVVAAFWLACA